MAKAPGMLTFSYGSSAFGGTPPFTTTMDFKVTTEPNPTDWTFFVQQCAEAWNDNICPKISEGLSGGLCTLTYTTDDDVLQVTWALDNGGADGHPRLPGASVRLIKQTTRPPGGRFGCIYLMGPVGSAYDDNGHITDTFFAAAWGDFRSDVLDADNVPEGFAFVQNHGHRSGDHIVYGTPTVFESVIAAPTVSFLRGRYR